MTKVPSLGYQQIIKALEREGWNCIRQKGSHIRMEKRTSSELLRITIPAHKPVKAKTLLRDEIKAKMESQSGMLIQYIEPVGIWSVNPYRKCALRCVYCIARTQGESMPWYGPKEVIWAVRTMLEQVPVHAELFVGSMTDAYPPVERDLGVTRLIIQEIINQQRPFCICTKSELVCRDIDLLSGYHEHCDVYLSLSTLDEQVIRILEPGAPSAAQRLDTLYRLSSAGIEVSIDAAPWIPGLSDASALISQLPPGAKIQFAPLDLRYCGGKTRLLGRTYIQDEINMAYYLERERIGEAKGIIWKDPL